MLHWIIIKYVFFWGRLHQFCVSSFRHMELFLELVTHALSLAIHLLKLSTVLGRVDTIWHFDWNTQNFTFRRGLFHTCNSRLYAIAYWHFWPTYSENKYPMTLMFYVLLYHVLYTDQTKSGIPKIRVFYRPLSGVALGTLRLTSKGSGGNDWVPKNVCIC